MHGRECRQTLFLVGPEQIDSVHHQSLSPQICHKQKQTNSDNGGFLRVPEERDFVAKTVQKRHFLSQ
jgi:hypothetical protein